MTLIGFFLGSSVPNVDKNIHIVVAIVVFLSILPVIIEALRQRSRKKSRMATAETEKSAF